MEVEKLVEVDKIVEVEKVVEKIVEKKVIEYVEVKVPAQKNDKGEKI